MKEQKGKLLDDYSSLMEKLEKQKEETKRAEIAIETERALNEER